MAMLVIGMEMTVRSTEITIRMTRYPRGLLGITYWARYCVCFLRYYTLWSEKNPTQKYLENKIKPQTNSSPASNLQPTFYLT